VSDQILQVELIEKKNGGISGEWKRHPELRSRIRVYYVMYFCQYRGTKRALPLQRQALSSRE